MFLKREIYEKIFLYIVCQSVVYFTFLIHIQRQACPFMFDKIKAYYILKNMFVIVRLNNSNH